MSWGYEKHNGPCTWHNDYPKAGGNRQSPIDIDVGACKSHSYVHPLKVQYSRETSMEVINNGFGFVASTKEENTISGGPLEETIYKLHSFHFHWGSDDSQGSEHTINKKAYPAELHLVHWNYKTYPDFADAASADDGITVLGVFLEIGEANETLQVLCDAMDKVKPSGSKHTIAKPFDLPSLAPKEPIKFYTYPGSLTTPPCHESVTWLVCKETMSCSAEQLLHFRALVAINSAPLVNNYRPVFKVGTRCVCSCE